MCTQHVKYFRKVLIQKIFADNFSFQPYPTAKIRLRLQSARGASLHAAGPPAPCSQTQPNLSKVGGLVFVLRHTRQYERHGFSMETHKPATEHWPSIGQEPAGRCLAQHTCGRQQSTMLPPHLWMGSQEMLCRSTQRQI